MIFSHADLDWNGCLFFVLPRIQADAKRRAEEAKARGEHLGFRWLNGHDEKLEW